MNTAGFSCFDGVHVASGNGVPYAANAGENARRRRSFLMNDHEDVVGGSTSVGWLEPKL
jgi:hypothetical protein